MFASVLEDTPLGTPTSNLTLVEEAMRSVRHYGAEPASSADMRRALGSIGGGGRTLRPIALQKQLTYCSRGQAIAFLFALSAGRAIRDSCFGFVFIDARAVGDRHRQTNAMPPRLPVVNFVATKTADQLAGAAISSRAARPAPAGK
jgi:hypothetical protein